MRIPSNLIYRRAKHRGTLIHDTHTLIQNRSPPLSVTTILKVGLLVTAASSSLYVYLNFAKERMKMERM